MPSVAPVGFDVPGLHESMPETKVISFSDAGPSFFEQLLDIINPLQHIPVVSTVYRAITGDQIAAPARLIGGALYGGPFAMASVAGNLLLEEATGKDLSDHVLGLVDDLGDSSDPADAAAPVAAVTPSGPPAVTHLAAVDDGVEIIWNGPRVVPSLARTAAAQGATVSDRAVEVSVIGASASNTAPVEREGGPMGPNHAGAASPNPGAPPPWLESAIADAKSVQGAAQLGKVAQKVEAQPWVTDAMLDALAKYETLARERNR